MHQTLWGVWLLVLNIRRLCSGGGSHSWFYWCLVSQPSLLSYHLYLAHMICCSGCKCLSRTHSFVFCWQHEKIKLGDTTTGYEACWPGLFRSGPDVTTFACKAVILVIFLLASCAIKHISVWFISLLQWLNCVFGENWLWRWWFKRKPWWKLSASGEVHDRWSITRVCTVPTWLHVCQHPKGQKVILWYLLCSTDSETILYLWFSPVWSAREVKGQNREHYG